MSAQHIGGMVPQAALEAQLLTQSCITDIAVLAGCPLALDKEAGPNVLELLADVAKEFVDEVSAFSVDLSQHRVSNTTEVKDVNMALEKLYGIKLPGYLSEPKGNSQVITANGAAARKLRRLSTNKTHIDRLRAIRMSSKSAALSSAGVPSASGLAGSSGGPGLSRDGASSSYGAEGGRRPGRPSTKSSKATGGVKRRRGEDE